MINKTSRTVTTVVISSLLIATLLFSVPLVPRVGAVSSSNLAISIDGPTLIFPGETAVFYFTTTANGNVVSPDNTTVTLYFPTYNVSDTQWNGGGNVASQQVGPLPVVLTPTQVTNGVYMVQWTAPSGAVTGFYAVVVYASYGYGTFAGLAVKGFEISQGLQNNQNQVMRGIAGLSSQLALVESNIASMLTTANTTVAKAPAPVISASAFLGGVFLPSASEAVSVTLGLVLLVLICAVAAISTALLLKHRSAELKLH